MQRASQHAQRASKTSAKLLAWLAIVLAALLAIKKMRPIIGETGPLLAILSFIC
jgi:hypothetical protein